MKYKVPTSVTESLVLDGKFLIRNINEETMQNFLNWIMRNRPRQSDFTVLIDSPGGSPGLMLHTASVFRTMKDDFNLTGVAIGECGSAAFALLQCCKTRIMIKNCGLFIHHIQSTFTQSAQNESFTEIKERIKFAKEMEEELVELQAKRCGMTKAKWMKIADRGDNISGRAILSKEARRLNLVDKVVDSYPIF